tara:strand:+ start:939 stop:1343 length:405 start_codon:yes stop_codon:yes gene_type:complete
MAYSGVETWDVVPDTYPVAVSVRRRGVRTPWAGPLVQRRQTFSSESAQGQAGIREFTLNFRLATKTEYNRAMALWKTSLGGALGINYTTTNEAYSGTEALVVRMKAAPFLLRKRAHNQYAFSVVLEEMLTNAPS